MKLVNWVWELETLPTAWSQGVIVNLFKAGDTRCQELQGITLVSICQDVYKHVAQAHGVPSAPARGSGGVQKQKILHRQLVRAHAHPQEAGKAKKLSMRSFWTCAKRMITVWRDGLSAKLLEKVWMESYGGSCET
jgi:hypothetical protein